MDEPLLIILIALAAAAIILLIVLLFKKPAKEASLKNELDDLASRQEMSGALTRQEIINQFKTLNSLSLQTMSQVSANTQRDIEAMRAAVDRRLAQIQADSQMKLESMRSTVDERLSKTLSQSLDNSFKTVSTQLKEVHSSMGELRGMAGDIVGLKHILAGVKQRGTWGEVQLGALLADMLSPGQFSAQAPIAKTQQKVDYAVKLPSRGDPVYIPVDSKFPLDRYSAVLSAQDTGETAKIKQANDLLKRAVLDQARDIKKKYICPPETADFAIMYLPSEGLYSHLAAMDMVYELQSKQNVLLAGPSTLAALLSSLQIGFKTVAVEKQSYEILGLLGKVKRTFSQFSGSVASAQKSLNAASNHLSDVVTKSNSMERHLRAVEDVDYDEQELTD